MLYPIKFKTIFKDKIWGGQKIRTILNKDFGALPNCGETWELSGVAGNISEVANGALAGKMLTELMDTYKGDLMGDKVYERFGNTFPLLIKFIDANEDLSIQVHPDDRLAMQRHNSFGKTEMWYILQADEGSSLIVGFNQDVDKATYLEKLHEKKLNDILNREPVKAGDVYFLPAGRVHTIGKGLLIAEIQQTSDITYRIYDFDRVDSEGKKRELHTEEAIDAIDYKSYPQYKTNYKETPNAVEPMVESSYFKTSVLQFNQTKTLSYDQIDSFVILIAVEGSFEVVFKELSNSLKAGESILIPAVCKQVQLKPQSNECKLLETFVP